VKKTLPVIIGIVFGAYALAEFYIPHHTVKEITEELQAWATVLTAAAFVIGGISIIQVTWPKIRRRDPDWQYKVVLLVSAAAMGFVGIPWHKLGDAEDVKPAIAVVGGHGGGGGRIEVVAPWDVTVGIGGTRAPAVQDGKPFTADLPAGPVEVVLSRRMAGYRTLTAKVELQEGQLVRVTGDPPMLWGRNGRPFTWLYDHVFDPANSTLFALLAFFVASAAFRAFRARNVEAALLLIAAIAVMLGRMPLGGWLSHVFPDLAQWLIDIPNNAGRRAIMMGAAIGAIATGLRVIVGLERAHLGSD
jgi:hypothetical protein